MVRESATSEFGTTEFGTTEGSEFLPLADRAFVRFEVAPNGAFGDSSGVGDLLIRPGLLAAARAVVPT